MEQTVESERLSHVQPVPQSNNRSNDPAGKKTDQKLSSTSKVIPYCETIPPPFTIIPREMLHRYRVSYHKLDDLDPRNITTHMLHVRLSVPELKSIGSVNRIKLGHAVKGPACITLAKFLTENDLIHPDKLTELITRADPEKVDESIMMIRQIVRKIVRKWLLSLADGIEVRQKVWHRTSERVSMYLKPSITEYSFRTTPKYHLPLDVYEAYEESYYDLMSRPKSFWTKNILQTRFTSRELSSIGSANSLTGTALELPKDQMVQRIFPYFRSEHLLYPYLVPVASSKSISFQLSSRASRIRGVVLRCLSPISLELNLSFEDQKHIAAHVDSFLSLPATKPRKSSKVQPPKASPLKTHPPYARPPNVQPSYVPMQPSYVQPSYVPMQPSYVQQSYVQPPYAQPPVFHLPVFQPPTQSPYMQPWQTQPWKMKPSMLKPPMLQPSMSPSNAQPPNAQLPIMQPVEVQPSVNASVNTSLDHSVLFLKRKQLTTYTACFPVLMSQPKQSWTVIDLCRRFSFKELDTIIRANSITRRSGDDRLVICQLLITYLESNNFVHPHKLQTHPRSLSHDFIRRHTQQSNMEKSTPVAQQSNNSSDAELTQIQHKTYRRLYLQLMSREKQKWTKIELDWYFTHIDLTCIHSINRLPVIYNNDKKSVMCEAVAEFIQSHALAHPDFLVARRWEDSERDTVSANSSNCSTPDSSSRNIEPDDNTFVQADQLDSELQSTASSIEYPIDHVMSEDVSKFIQSLQLIRPDSLKVDHSDDAQRDTVPVNSSRVNSALPSSSSTDIQPDDSNASLMYDSIVIEPSFDQSAGQLNRELQLAKPLVDDTVTPVLDQSINPSVVEMDSSVSHVLVDQPINQSVDLSIDHAVVDTDSSVSHDPIDQPDSHSISQSTNQVFDDPPLFGDVFFEVVSVPSANKSTKRSHQQMTEWNDDQSVDRSADESTNRPSVQSSTQSIDTSIDLAYDQSSNRSNENSINQSVTAANYEWENERDLFRKRLEAFRTSID